MTFEGIFRELKKHKEYEKPSEKRRREKTEARKRLLKKNSTKEIYESGNKSS